MIDTSSVGSVEVVGLTRLNPRQIAIKLFQSGEQTISVLDATDEQFEAFRLAVGIPVKEGEEGKRWSFDNRCRAINHALKYDLKLPFVEQKQFGKCSDSEHFEPVEPAPQANVIGGEPN